MMSMFLAKHREELIRRCAAKVALRPLRMPPGAQLSGGIPLFLTQLQHTLEAEGQQHPGESLKISGGTGGDPLSISDMGASASLHGQELLGLGFTVDQVVHDYGDLCQAVTELAVELDVPIAVNEFRTLNRCLDNGIASAVTGFSAQRDASVAADTHAQASERLEALLLALRSSLAAATYALAAMELGNLPASGSTGAILKKSLATMRNHVGGPVPDEGD